MKIDNSRNHRGMLSAAGHFFLFFRKKSHDGTDSESLPVSGKREFRTRMPGFVKRNGKSKKHEISAKKSQLDEEFDAVKKNPGQLTGWDFDRAFEFIERHPDTAEAKILVGQMYAAKGPTLKGLSYASAVKILKNMPDHTGSGAIIRGMRLLEEDFIQELRSDVIAYIIETIPDHPLVEALTTALATKNLTSAYDFIINNPDNVHTQKVIKAMFDRDPNVAVLLLQEKMDHPQVGSIFDGIYSITKESDIKKLTPSAVIFILDVAPDHPAVEKMIEGLVEDNYVKAYEFIKYHPDHVLTDLIKKKILVRKPELKKLFIEE